MGQPSGLPDPRADVPGLRAFVAVARSGTVGAAAERLGRAQPSISARLSALEAAWGTRLFRRTARGMALTPEGARLLPRAETALRELEALDEAAGAPLARLSLLRLGAGDALGRARLPQALERLGRETRALDVQVREGPRPALLGALIGGEIDLALVARSQAPEPVLGIDLEPLLESGIDVLAPRGLLPPGSRSVRLAGLAAHRLVTLQAGSEFRRHLERSYRRAGIPFEPAVEVGNLSLVRRFVAGGLGVAAVPAVAFEGQDEVQGVERRRLDGVPRLIYERAVRLGAPLPAEASRLLELLAGDSAEARRP